MSAKQSTEWIVDIEVVAINVPDNIIWLRAPGEPEAYKSRFDQSIIYKCLTVAAMVAQNAIEATRIVYQKVFIDMVQRGAT